MKRGSLLFSCIVLSGLAASAVAAEVKVLNPVPYSESAVIAGNIKRECSIGTQLADALKREAAASGKQIVFSAEALDIAQGDVLKMEIVDAQSSGNAWTGHHKAVSVRGELFKGGVRIAGFTARRTSMGGFGGGFKGSCAVLERTVNAIGRDVAQWLTKPADGAQLGNL